MATPAPKHKVIFTEKAVPPLPPFSQATVINGIVYCSGSIGCDKDFNLADGVQAQTRAALENISKVLSASGSSLKHILKTTVYLTDMKNFAAMNDEYMKIIPPNPDGNPPARTCIAVVALPLGAEVEIECIAAVAE